MTVLAAPAISGTFDPRFESVRAAFAQLFADGLEIGGAVAVTIDGEPVIDLWAGADRKNVPIGPETLFPVFSCSKPIASLVIARLVEAGALGYERKVADLWPEFAQGGKSEVTVAQALSHQAGLCGIPSDWRAEDWFDWDKTCARLAAMEPLWPLGRGSGYHPITWGYLAGEIARRADGRTLGAILREDVCAPRDLDFHIGLSQRDHDRAANAEKPRDIPDFGEIGPEVTAAFFQPWSYPAGRSAGEWRAFEFPAHGGHGTARAMARLMEAYARAGMVGEDRLLAPKTMAEAMKERVSGRDRVLPYDVSWGVGLVRNRPGLTYYGSGPRGVGHTGFGGSTVMADPDRGLAFGYATSRQEAALIGDRRANRLIAALYAALDGGAP